MKAEEGLTNLGAGLLGLDGLFGTVSSGVGRSDGSSGSLSGSATGRGAGGRLGELDVDSPAGEVRLVKSRDRGNGVGLLDERHEAVTTLSCQLDQVLQRKPC